MEGTYITKDQRVKLSHEIRQTHFKLGGGAHGFKSTSSQYYPKHETSAMGGTDKHQSNMRRAHFSIGEGSAKNNAESEFTAKYRPHPLSSIAQSKTHGEIRKSHFQLGNAKPVLTSTSARSYTSNKTIVAAKQHDNNLRQHHFHLGNDNKAVQSTAQAAFGKKEAVVNQANTHLKNDLRTSHFQLGSGPKLFSSTSAVSFRHKKGEASVLNKELKKDLKKEHFTLGADNMFLQSTAQASFQPRPGDKQELNNEKLTDLRKSHFTLGNSQSTYSLTSRTNYVPTSVLAPSGSSVELRKTNFILGDDKPSYLTANNTFVKNKQGEVPEKHRERTTDINSQICLGKEGYANNSTARADFKHFSDAKPGALNIEQARNLRQHHFQYGPGRAEYATTSGNYGSKNGKPSTVDPNLIKDLRSTHFKWGNDPVSFMTVNQKDFVKKDQGHGQFNSELAKNLRRHHFDIGQKEGYWQTENKSEFKWVQPVPAKNVKFTLTK